MFGNTFHGPAAIVTGPYGVQRNHFHPASPRPAAPWPHQVGLIPPRAQSFQERAQGVRLREALQGGGTAVLCQVLTGMGGVGKTQLAADYARTSWNAGHGALDVLVWITAATRDVIVAAYAQAGIELCQADPADPEQAARTFLAWLSPKGPRHACRWLVVLDDVAEPSDLHGLWPPESPTGQTLVTTRRRDAALTGQDRHLIDIGLFIPAQAAGYLTAALAAHGRQESTGQLTGLAADLGYLPLALAQAVAYLTDTGESVADYRAQLADRGRRLAELLPDYLPDDQRSPVAALWSLSVDRADELTPAGLARPMLRLLAVLDPNGIPHTALTSRPALAYLTRHRTRTGAGAAAAAAAAADSESEPVTSRDATRALRALHRLSLASHTPDDAYQTVRIHQLVQRTVLDQLTEDSRQDLARTAADALLSVWPRFDGEPDLGVALRANTDVLTRLGNHLWSPGAHAILFRVGSSIGDFGQATAAASFYRRLADQAGRFLGFDHPDTLTAQYQLAHWRGETGDRAGAVATLEQLLPVQVRVLGPDHPDTLTTRVWLAWWQSEAESPDGTSEAVAELLDGLAGIHGPDHTGTLLAWTNLALWQAATWNQAGALAVYERLVAAQERVLGPNHADTLQSRRRLIHWRVERGDWAAAVPAYRRLLHDSERVFGPDHPNTVNTRTELAQVLSIYVGDDVAAIAELEKVFASLERSLGPDHPTTIRVRKDLESSRRELGKPNWRRDPAYADLSYHAQVFRATRRKRGSGPADALLAEAVNIHFQEEGAASAAAAYTRLISEMNHALGRDHPITLHTRQRLAEIQGEAHSAAVATASYQQLLEDMSRALGPHHPDTLTTRHGLAHWQGLSGNPGAAVGEYERLIGQWEEIHGPDHPHSLTLRHGLAHWRGMSGDMVSAANEYERLADQWERILGATHEHTRRTLDVLALWRRDAGDLASAVATYERLLALDDSTWRSTDRTALRSAIDLCRQEASVPGFEPTREQRLRLDRVRVSNADYAQSGNPANGHVVLSRYNLRPWGLGLLIPLERWEGLDRDIPSKTYALVDHEHVCGPDHRQTLALRHELANREGVRGYPAQAVAALRQLMTDLVRIQGADHPDTVRARQNLARWEHVAVHGDQPEEPEPPERLEEPDQPTALEDPEPSKLPEMLKRHEWPKQPKQLEQPEPPAVNAGLVERLSVLVAKYLGTA
ncbi:tetratricopeptide repeat protein [Streptomyces sp. NPDC059816]|uniref:tetratricopeptide repeat protein n=1 Tax=Streptomyces sp. NPDC059816 TaxID=3346960 RepID=UPI00365E6F4D